MNSKTRENGAFQWTVWVVGGASLLFFISAGLELFVQRTLGHSSVAIVILDLFLAFWSYVLGLGLLLFLSVWCLVRWHRERVTRLAISRYAPAEPRSRGLEKPEQAFINTSSSGSLLVRCDRSEPVRMRDTVSPELPEQVVK